VSISSLLDLDLPLLLLLAVDSGFIGTGVGTGTAFGVFAGDAAAGGFDADPSVIDGSHPPSFRPASRRAGLGAASSSTRNGCSLFDRLSCIELHAQVTCTMTAPLLATSSATELSWSMREEGTPTMCVAPDQRGTRVAPRSYEVAA
jgi:hypothetical protein